MTFSSFLIFIFALFVAAATPGPGVTAIAARVLAGQKRESIPFALGIAIGDVAWLSLAVFGLVVLAQTYAHVFLVLKWCGVLYLLYLAWLFLTKPSGHFEVEASHIKKESTTRLIMAGMFLTGGNPKAMLFYLALTPTLIDLERITLLIYFELVACVFVVLGLVFAAYIYIAHRARGLILSSHQSQRFLKWFHRGAGGVLAGTALVIASR